MGNTIRRNDAASDAQRARYAILQGRRAAQRDRAEARAYDDRALSARTAQTGRA